MGKIETPGLDTFILHKINSIEVSWVGSSLVGNNPSQDGSKINTEEGSKRDQLYRDAANIIGKPQSSGETKNIEAGRSKRKYTSEFLVKDVSSKRALNNILFNTKECILTDINGATARVFIDSYTIQDDLSTAGRSKYTITFTIQEGGIKPPVNPTTDLKNVKDSLKESIQKKIEESKDKFSSETTEEFKDKIRAQIKSAKEKGYNVSFLDKHLSDVIGEYPFEGVLSFTDPATELFKKGIDKFLEAKLAVFSPIIKDKIRINTVKKLVESIKVLSDTPNELLNLLTDIAEDLGLVYDVKDVSPFDVARKSEILPVYSPVIDGKNVIEVAKSDVEKISTTEVEEITLSEFIPGFGRVSTIEAEDLEKQWIMCTLLNSTKVLSDVNLLLTGGFFDVKDFETTVKQIYEYVGYCGFTSEEIENIIHKVNMYANTQDYRETTEIFVKDWTPLYRIVYDRYGDLKDYSLISSLNNFSNNARVRGKVKILV